MYIEMKAMPWRLRVVWPSLISHQPTRDEEGGEYKKEKKKK